ncbi:outer membrane protein assembly factor BamE [Labilibacter sediminis]|nr:outer membrane protein assembly factor BamE [Labilibacter sediminis]
MKTHILKLGLITLIFTALTTNCSVSKTASLNSIKLTSQLAPGMSYEQVLSILGEPKNTQIKDDQLIARWNLQEMWKGYIPYDFIFDAKDKTLISWAENTKAYQESQQQLKTISEELEKQNQVIQSAGNNTPNFENNTQLMSAFAGAYYSFSAVGGGQTGGTETKIMLCRNGTYRNQSETGYSGEGWGSASQGAGQGTWKITGDWNSGTLVTTGQDGQSTTYNYKRCASDCVYFGNTKFAYAGEPDC